VRHIEGYDNQISKWETRNHKGFRRIKDTRIHHENCVEAGDMGGVLLMNRQTDVNMRLSPMHTGLAMQEFINEFAAYTDGAPITGASGGYAVGLLKSEYSKNDIVKIFNPVTEKSPSSKLPLLTNVRVNIVSL
jgi:hypothetical protein